MIPYRKLRNIAWPASMKGLPRDLHLNGRVRK